ncbi:MAG: hypothetical protein K1X78_14680 [Verrucomicrobiaceae bacterium]|nr:hypothetical protein [Verrucomicrobiaceae bacterium]
MFHRDWYLQGAAISDVTSLKGAPISRLNVGRTTVSDLAPLRGMALKELRCFNTKVADLSPFQGMPLEHLQLSGSPVTDLTPLRGMGLITLALHNCPQITDLTPLAEAKALTSLTLPPNAKDIEFLRTFPKLERLGTQDAKTGGGQPGQPGQPVAEFWKEWDAKK